MIMNNLPIQRDGFNNAVGTNPTTKLPSHPKTTKRAFDVAFLLSHDNEPRRTTDELPRDAKEPRISSDEKCTLNNPQMVPKSTTRSKHEQQNHHQRSAFTKVNLAHHQKLENPDWTYQCASPALTNSPSPDSEGLYPSIHSKSPGVSPNQLPGMRYFCNYTNDGLLAAKNQLEQQMINSTNVSNAFTHRLRQNFLNYPPAYAAYALQNNATATGAVSIAAAAANDYAVKFAAPPSTTAGEFIKMQNSISSTTAALLNTLLPPSLAALSLPAQNVCAKCNISFRMTSDLVYHMRSHHKNENTNESSKKRKEDKLKCPVCNESFRERHHLTRHMTAHQDKEDDFIDEASTSFAHRSNSKKMSKGMKLNMNGSNVFL